MEIDIFYIRSLLAQNFIMGTVTVIIAGLLVRAVLRRKTDHLIAIAVWVCIVMWFFNGPLWGFSAVTVGPQGLEMHYGFLSVFKKTELPPDTAWKIETYMGGVRRIQKLYYLQLPTDKSLKVSGSKLAVLKSIGQAIDQVNGRAMGSMENRPVNL